MLAVVALLAARSVGCIGMDPVMRILGASLVARWWFGLLPTTSLIVLDRQGPKTIRRRIKESIEEDLDSRAADLHLWSIGPNLYAVINPVVAHAAATPDEHKARIPKILGLAHISIEIHPCATNEKRSGFAATANIRFGR